MQLAMDDDPAALSLACPTCGGPVDVRSRHLVVHGSAVQIYCSLPCKETALLGDSLDEIAIENERPRRRMVPLATGSALLGSLFVYDHRAVDLPMPALPPPPVIAAPAVVEPEPPAKVHGPSWPPTEAEWIAVISRDVWIHPLDGPVRRMPVRDSRVFGAPRDGERPAECRNGHCGVDIGETWGEPVMAVHEGVVDHVQRGPNEDHGGLYVRLSHRGGTVFTQYFHLAAIPRWVTAGRHVGAGDVIGLVGDTGVKQSGPHLHFTISVKAARHLPEQYIDPEPLIALWPLRVQTGGSAAVSVLEAPGRVRGAATKRRKKKRKARPPDEVPAAIGVIAGPSGDALASPAPPDAAARQ